MKVKLSICCRIAVCLGPYTRGSNYFIGGQEVTCVMNQRKTEIMWVNVEKFEKKEAKRLL